MDNTLSKLNQLLAVSKTVKNDTHRAITGAYQNLQKLPLLSGIVRTYEPAEDGGEQLPPESQHVQLKVDAVLADVKKALMRLFDVTANIDDTNCYARADIIVDDLVILANVPATHLLFLEKQLTDLRTLITKLPVLDSQYVWRFDNNLGCYATEPRTTSRTKKVPRVIVAYEATDRHPAQTSIIQEDVTAGHWKTRNLSGAIRQVDVGILLDRVTVLYEAVKKAREAANMTPVTQFTSAPVLDWLFNG